ncbi:hypothetical protein IE53DRAFT_342000, partial [Violaceomyces palustris]
MSSQPSSSSSSSSSNPLPTEPTRNGNPPNQGPQVSNQQPSKSWLSSIDRTYHLFESPDLRSKYPRLSSKVKDAVELMERVLLEVGLERSCLSFNGGKDCTVLVHLLCSVVRRIRGMTTTSSPPPQLASIPSLYISCPSPFEEMERFIDRSSHPLTGYNLDLVTVEGGMKQGLQTYLEGGGVRWERVERNENPGHEPPRKRDVRAVFIGTRRNDPHGGYTSLGSTFNTHPNPTLKVIEDPPSSIQKWRPAYMLEDESLERAGRE